MERINPDLLDRLEEKLGLSRSQVYRLIEKQVSKTYLPRHLAAISIASEHNINVSRYASNDELAEIRRTGGSEGTPNGPVDKSSPPKLQKSRTLRKARGNATSKKRRGTSVFVVHGRNEKIRQSLFSFLRSIGLHPIEWTKAIALTEKPSPYVGDILDSAFNNAVAVIVLLTPDDQAKLSNDLIKSSDEPFEKTLTGQARPNVLFEAGMAFGTHPEQTVLVQVGRIRPFSDVAGRHILHLTNSTPKRQEFIQKLKNAGCEIDDVGTDWHSEGDFSL